MKRPFQVGDTVMYKNNRSSGLSGKFLGPYRISNIIVNNCEIESIDTGRKRCVHCNDLKCSNAVEMLEGNIASNHELEQSDNSETEDFIVKTPIAKERLESVRNNRYNLRRERRLPERYGCPVTDY